MRPYRKTLLTLLLLGVCSRASALTAKVEVLSSATELAEWFSATAIVHSGFMEVTLVPTAKWAMLGPFRGYRLRVLPFAVTVESIERDYWKHNAKSVVASIDGKVGHFSLATEKIPGAYIVAHFGGGNFQNTDMVEVCVPLSTCLLLVQKQPIQLAEPPQDAVH